VICHGEAALVVYQVVVSNDNGHHFKQGENKMRSRPWYRGLKLIITGVISIRKDGAMGTMAKKFILFLEIELFGYR
jgi:hypothetical protein